MTEVPQVYTPPPITEEAGGESIIIGKFDLGSPLEVNINDPALAARKEYLVKFAQDILGPACDEVFVIGMECGQYSMSLAEVLHFARDIGCQCIQPSGNHIDLARAATDPQYRMAIWNLFQVARLPLTSVSVHVDFYAALAIRHDQKAGMFTPKDISEKGFDPEATSMEHMNKLALMIIGAAQMGISDLHLFWGMPTSIAPYGWPPQSNDDVLAMRRQFCAAVKRLIELAIRVGVNLCHEIHFGTIAMNSDDFIAVWTMLGKPECFCVGEDPSHCWHGESWQAAMDKRRVAGVKSKLAHAKNTVIISGRPSLGNEMDDRLRGMSFTSLDNPAGIVSMHDYLGFLTMSGLTEHWRARGLPAPVYVEAENPFFRINEVTAKGVAYLRGIAGGLRLPKGHFTDAMARK
jgi:sugar phosphate isomerase/epimerase